MPGGRSLADLERGLGWPGGTTGVPAVLREMRPEDVTKEVTASGLQGRGGAAFAAHGQQATARSFIASFWLATSNVPLVSLPRESMATYWNLGIGTRCI